MRQDNFVVRIFAFCISAKSLSVCRLRPVIAPLISIAIHLPVQTATFHEDFGDTLRRVQLNLVIFKSWKRLGLMWAQR